MYFETGSLEAHLLTSLAGMGGQGFACLPSRNAVLGITDTLQSPAFP